MVHARLADLQGQAFVPVLAPVVTPEVVDEIAPLPAQALPGLLPEAELSALPEAPLMPFDPTSRFEQAVLLAVGTPAKLIELAAHRQQRALRGLAAARRVFEVRAA